jgi:hypothetical protein
VVTRNRAAILSANANLNALTIGPLNAVVFKKVDPYLKWALITNFEGYRRTFANKLPFLIHAPKLASRQSATALGAMGIQINGAYVAQVPPGDVWQEYATGLVDVGDLVALHEEIVLKGEGACKLGLPAAPQVQVAPPTGGVAGFLSRPFFGIIDHGIGFANRAFDDGGGYPRIEKFWDQDPSSLSRPIGGVANWSNNQNFAYGVVIDSASINSARRNLGETKTYAMSGYTPAQKRLSHGTHVLDLAAGKRRASPPDDAEKASIFAVQLPWRPFKDTSGASLCVHILDGLQWIKLSVDRGAPVVVNISDGAYAGPGKGRSLLERAIDGMVRPVVSAEGLSRPSDMRLVLAAGNGAKRRGHAAGELQALKSSGQIAFQVLPDTPIDTMIEVWIDSTEALDLDNKKVAVELTSPSGETITVDLSNDLGALEDASGRYTAMANATDQSPDCQDLLGFVIAISPTRKSPFMAKRGRAPHGLWSLEIHNLSTVAISFSAQIQRANPALGDKGTRREARFAKGGKAATYVTRDETLNNIATGANSITVGGCLVKGNPWPDPSHPMNREFEVEYSSRGAAVSVLAPSDYSLGLHGILAAGSRSGTLARMDGTSVAAPQVARALLNALVIPANRLIPNAALLTTLTAPPAPGVAVPRMLLP